MAQRTSVSRPRTVRDDQVAADTCVMIRGNIAYSHLTRKIEGEELIKDQQRRSRANRIPIDKPYTTVTLSNARVIPVDPANETLEEKFVNERNFWKHANDSADAPWNYSIVDKSPYEHKFYQARPDEPNVADRFIPAAELANGLDVLLVVRIFQTKSFQNKSVAIDRIIVKEPVRYYDGSNNDKEMARLGLILNENENSAPSAPVTNVEGDTIVTPNMENNGPKNETNVYATSSAAPANHATPPSPWICPTCNEVMPATQQFCGKCGTKREEANLNPFAPASQDQGGIRFNPNSGDRNY